MAIKIYGYFIKTKGDHDMTIGSQEHYEILEAFEKFAKGCRLDREPVGLWRSKVIYQDGMANNLYNAYIAGYANGKCTYLNQ
jgi:hypothetical protein